MYFPAYPEQMFRSILASSDQVSVRDLVGTVSV